MYLLSGMPDFLTYDSDLYPYDVPCNSPNVFYISVRKDINLSK